MGSDESANEKEGAIDKMQSKFGIFINVHLFNLWMKMAGAKEICLI
jgi:hypothetical protein